MLTVQLDTLKTRVQSAAGASIGSVVRSVPDIGLRGLYRRAALLTHPLQRLKRHCTTGLCRRPGERA